MTNLLSLKLHEKVYKSKAGCSSILNGFAMDLNEGDSVAIVGPSGVGKSSLLNILGLIDADYSGSYSFRGKDTRSLSDAQLARYRNENIGFVLQDSALIDSLHIGDNICLPLLYSTSVSLNEGRRRLLEIARLIDIEGILEKKPLECSGGQRARAVFARAVIMSPDLLLADEPTASLDNVNENRILDLVFELNDRLNTTIVTVTHDIGVAERHSRIIEL